MIAPRPEPPKQKVTLERVYVWQVPVRVTHWVLFFSIVVLSATGYYMGRPYIDVPGAAKDHFVMGTMIAVHNYAAVFFTLAVIARLYWFFVGNRYARLSEFIPVSKQRLRSLWESFLYYSFIRHDPTHYAVHNALAGAIYAMLFVVYILLIVTGVVLYAVDTTIGAPIRVFEYLAPLLGGLPMTRLLHHLGMWIILIFAVVHIYTVLLSSLIEHVGTFDSIFSGYKFMPVRKADKP